MKRSSKIGVGIALALALALSACAGSSGSYRASMAPPSSGGGSYGGAPAMPEAMPAAERSVMVSAAPAPQSTGGLFSRRRASDPPRGPAKEERFFRGQVVAAAGPKVAAGTTRPTTTTVATTTPQTSPAQARGPMLVYTASLIMSVFEVGKGLNAAEIIGRQMGGFLARRSDTAITIRVPAERFDETVKSLEKIGDMLHRDITAEDITEQFHDTEIRLKNARAVRDRLQYLLARAANVRDALEVERELERVAGEIERLEGRLKFLRDRATFSTITVSFQPRPRELVTKGTFRLPFPWLDQLGLGRLLQLQ